MLDHDLSKLSKFIKQEFSKLGLPYGWNNKRETKWSSFYVYLHPELADEDFSMLYDPVDAERVKSNFANEPKYLEQGLKTIYWNYVYKKIPVFGWNGQLDLVKRNYYSQETAEKNLLTWYKKNEHAGRMLLEKIIKILKVLNKYDENVLNSEYLSAVNAGEVTKIAQP